MITETDNNSKQKRGSRMILYLILLPVALLLTGPLFAQEEKDGVEDKLFNPLRPQIFWDVGIGRAATVFGVAEDFAGLSVGTGVGYTGNLYASLINIFGFQLPFSYSSMENLNSAALSLEGASTDKDATGSAYSLEPRLGFMLLVDQGEPDYLFLYIGYLYANGEATAGEEEIEVTRSGLTFGFEDVSLFNFPGNFGIGLISGFGFNIATPQEYKDKDGTQKIKDAIGLGLAYKLGLRVQKDFWYLQLHYTADLGAGVGETENGKDIIALVGLGGFYLNFGMYF